MRKKIIISVFGLLFVGLLALYFSGELLFDGYVKKQIKEAAKKEWGLDINIEKIRHRPLQPLYLDIQNITIMDHGRLIGDIQDMEVKLHIFPMLRRKISVGLLTLNASKLHVDEKLLERLEFEKEFIEKVEESVSWVTSVGVDEVTVKIRDGGYNTYRAQDIELSISRIDIDDVTKKPQDMELDVKALNLQSSLIKAEGVTCTQCNVGIKKIRLDTDSVEVYAYQTKAQQLDYKGQYQVQSLQTQLEKIKIHPVVTITSDVSVQTKSLVIQTALVQGPQDLSVTDASIGTSNLQTTLNMEPALTLDLNSEEIDVEINKASFDVYALEELNVRTYDIALGELQFEDVKGHVSFSQTTTEISEANWKEISLVGLELEQNDFFVSLADPIDTKLHLNMKQRLEQLSMPSIRADDCLTRLSVEKGWANLLEHQCVVFGQPWTLTAKSKFSPVIENSELHTTLSSLDLEKVSTYAKDELPYPMRGLLDLKADVFVKDLSHVRKASGSIYINSDHIEIDGINADKFIDNFVDSQKTSLLNVAGFVTMGPLGALATQGAELTTSVPGLTGGQTVIHKLHTHIQFDDERANFHDVALTTDRQRVAVKGAINVHDQTFDRVRVGFLNAKGCAPVIQKIDGSVSNPKFGVGSTVVGSMFSPLTNLAEDVGDLFTGGCDIFYEGTVDHPQVAKKKSNKQTSKSNENKEEK